MQSSMQLLTVTQPLSDTSSNAGKQILKVFMTDNPCPESNLATDRVIGPRSNSSSFPTTCSHHHTYLEIETAGRLGGFVHRSPGMTLNHGLRRSRPIPT